MEENNDIFLAGCWLSYFSVLGRTNAQKNIPQHLFGAIHLVRMYLRSDFSAQPPNPPLPCKHMYALRVTVSAAGLFQEILLNTIAHMY